MYKLWQHIKHVENMWSHGDFDRGVSVGSRRAGLSISKTVDLLGLKGKRPEWCKKKKMLIKLAKSSELEVCGGFVADRKVTVTQITAEKPTQQHVEPWGGWHQIRFLKPITVDADSL